MQFLSFQSGLKCEFYFYYLYNRRGVQPKPVKAERARGEGVQRHPVRRICEKCGSTGYSGTPDDVPPFRGTGGTPKIKNWENLVINGFLSNGIPIIALFYKDVFLSLRLEVNVGK